MRLRPLSAPTSWLIYLIPTLALAGTACARPPDIAPEARVFQVASWSELRLVHQDLGGRLDGVVAGAFTEKVADLFAERWELLDEFARLAARHQVFESDVIAALNEAVPQAQTAKIVVNARTRCPARHASLCKRLLNALAPAGK